MARLVTAVVRSRQFAWAQADPAGQVRAVLDEVRGPGTTASSHYRLGPEVEGEIDIDIAVVPSMGLGGIPRRAPKGAWRSLASGSAWGAERLPFPLPFDRARMSSFAPES